MTARKAITSRMKIDCLLFRGNFYCSVCKEPLIVGVELDWDHIHELADDGGHWFGNLRPLHRACHRIKTAKATTHRAHIKRLARGKRKSKRPLKSAKRPWPKRAFQKRETA